MENRRRHTVMAFPTGDASAEDELAFVRRRVGIVAAVVAVIAAVGGVAPLLVVGGFAPGSEYALAAAACFGGVALACLTLPVGRRALAVVEAAGFIPGSLLVAMGSFSLGLEVRPELMAIGGLTYILVLRAALVPTSVRQTLLLCVLIGAPLVTMTHWQYAREGDFFTRVDSSLQSPGVATFWAAVWWSWTTLVCTIIARVVHDLRRDVRQARRLGQYFLDERLGAGGMGEVWHATHRFLRRPAAVKLIRPEALGAAGPGARGVQARFEREAQTTASLESPHTVVLYDFGVSDDGVFYHVMEFLDGWDLETLVLEHGPLPPERVLFLVDQVCDSLDDAHAAGLVHRDVKPANLFLTRRGRRFDFVKVLDFGLARPIEVGGGDTRVTRRGPMAGTPAYMAPEIFSGLPPDERSDLYAVGCVAYWLLTGTRVFEATTLTAMAAAHASEAPVRPSERIGLPLPDSLEQIVLACLAKEPANRPSSALELASELRACAIAPPWTADRAREWWSRHRPSTIRAAASLASTETRVLNPRD